MKSAFAPLALFAWFASMASSSVPARADGPPSRQDVADLRSDVDSDYYHVAIMTDDRGDAVALSVYERDEAGKVFGLESLRTGAVLMRNSGRNVITVSGPGLDPRNGGTFSLIYLKNGLSGSTVRFDMELVRLGHRWALYTAKNRGYYPFTHFMVRGNRWLGRLVGIGRIDVN